MSSKRSNTNASAQTRQKRQRRIGWGAWTALLGLAGFAVWQLRDVHADGVAQVMTAKKLPEATVAVIDPESGTSSGTSGSDVRLAVGDIILFKFAFTPVPDKINRGLQGYLTEYMPPNTELVGVRITDLEGRTIEPRQAGIAVDGCQGGAACNSASGLPSSSGNRNLQTGSIAQVHADTGVFYTTDPRLSPNPGNQFITMDNGIQMTAQPATISPGIVALLNDTTGPYFAHNDWDYAQVRAFGAASGFGGGDGNTPFRYGSPVAGPDTFYQYEVTDDAGSLLFDDVEGPWERVRYPGSVLGAGTGNIGSSSNITRVGAETVAGFDLTPASSVDATAVRVALGETRTGEPGFVEVALRVTGVPIDPTFLGGPANVNCGEVFGSDTSSRGGNSGAKDNPWPSYIGSPACVYLRLLFDLDVDKTLATGADNLNYTLRGKNLSVDPETNAVARLKFDQSRQSFVAATPPPDSNATCTDDGTKQCLTWNLGTLAPSDEYVIEAEFDVGGGGQTTNVLIANYISDQLPAPGFDTQALSIVTGIAVPKISLAPNFDPTTTFANANGTVAMTGTISNIGTAEWSHSELNLRLPTGWSINGNVRVGATNLTCSGTCTGTNTPIYNIPNGVSGYMPAQSRTLTFTANVPNGTAVGLYRFDVGAWGSQSGFGGSFETLFPKAAFVNVGQRRSQIPTITCPVASTAPSITGTSEGNANISVRFNLMERGTGTANGSGAWSSTNFTSFGEMYGGLEITATAQAPGELPSLPSQACFVTGVKACSDGFDNDSDGLTDFPADPGCDSPGDNSEVDPAAPQCADGLDNNGAGGIDWPADPSCSGPTDNTENGVRACADGVDNDGDGDTDFPADSDCTSANDGTEVTYRACQDGLDNDGDGLIDFAGGVGDPGCDADFDTTEVNLSSSADSRARLLLVLDSSGSMNWNTCDDDFTGGDGSNECPGTDIACNVCGGDGCGNGLADDSRLAKVKAGLSNVVAAFGEVDYSLMRFHQRGTDFACPSPAASLASGGWQGGGAAPCAGGFNAGDLLVSFSPDNEQDLLGYIDGDSNYDGIAPISTDFEVRGSGTTPLGGSLVSANDYIDDVRADDPKAACRPYRVILITDGAETCGGNPVQAATNLAGDNAPVYVIGFATPDLTVINNLDAIAAAGGTGGAIFVDDEVALSQALATIIQEASLSELCNSLDDDCDVLIDEDFPDKGDACTNGQLGECRREGVKICAANQLGTECNAPTITPGTEICNGLDDDCDAAVDENLAGCSCNPVDEVCNGQDDDCDGQTDEAPLPGVGEDCGFDVGECSEGSLACVAGGLVCQGGNGPVDESCNTLDDDCDSFVDELAEVCYTFPSGCGPGGCLGQCRTGVETCSPAGVCVGQVGPTAELCNGLDDDCDGSIDEAFPTLGDACTNGQAGVCEQPGILVCNAAGTGVVCNAATVTPGLETCNGDDDDCDSIVDEDLGAPIGDACGGGGSCSGGIFECIAGEVVCTGNSGGEPETCNGADDDCDSFVDELPLPGVGLDCVEPGFEAFGDIGECEFGDTICAGGAIVCDGYVGPRPEICNGLDDNCDGVADENAECPGGGSACVEGQCALPCIDDEIACPFGFYCEDTGGGRFCLADPCVDIVCDPGFLCDRDTEACVDLCTDVTCNDGLTCFGGLCQDCFSLGCDDGNVCVVSSQTGFGVCEPDPCFGVVCEPGQACDNGTCANVVCDPACVDGFRCDAGTCVVDLCDDVTCADGTLCDPATGGCVLDLCDGINCGAGLACDPRTGACIADPCRFVDCPVGTACELDLLGEPNCVVPTPIDEGDTIYTGGGGGCATSGGNAGALSGLMVGLAALVARRRRRRG